MKILVGLSGGVDSAVSSYLLKSQGHEVVCGFMKNYVSDTGDCTTYKDAESAIQVAKFLGLKLISFDFQKEYEQKIINYIYQGYKSGITPNPDILCNNLIKFDLFLQEAINLGYDKIATGHYSIIKYDKKTKFFELHQGIDPNKDQSYFLSGLNQHQLSKSLFPLGEYAKQEVRKIAKQVGLPNADRPDSQGLCFIGNIKIKDFLKKRLPEKKGDIILTDGTKVGEHNGAYFFTIGQSRGLDINKKAYVTKIDTKKNLVIVSYNKNDPQLQKNQVNIKKWHRISNQYKLPTEVSTKIRYRQIPNPSVFVSLENGEGIFEYKKKQRGVAPGQTLVAYENTKCIGNGIII